MGVALVLVNYQAVRRLQPFVCLFVPKWYSHLKNRVDPFTPVSSHNVVRMVPVCVRPSENAVNQSSGSCSFRSAEVEFHETSPSTIQKLPGFQEHWGFPALGGDRATAWAHPSLRGALP